MIEYFLAAFFAGSVVAPPVVAATPEPADTSRPAMAPGSIKVPILINAPRFQFDGKRNEAVYAGGVKVRRGETSLFCDRLVAHFTQNQQVSRIECIGSVEVLDGDRYAKGERADMDNLNGVVEVTGSPEARQGPNVMRGTRVLFFLGRDVLQVENATTIIDTSGGKLPKLPVGKLPASAPKGK